MTKHRVLFVCVHNSARSQMAEELLRKIAGDRFEVESAGLEPGTLNPHAVAALREEGIDITGKKTVSAFDLLKQGRYYTYVITVCDETSAESCPIFPETQGDAALELSRPFEIHRDRRGDYGEGEGIEGQDKGKDLRVGRGRRKSG